MILYYRDSDGDFLAIVTSTNRYYLTTFGKDYFQGRATSIKGVVGSVCTTDISRDYLRTKCKRVAKTKVPEEWLRAIGL